MNYDIRETMADTQQALLATSVVINICDLQLSFLKTGSGCV